MHENGRPPASRFFCAYPDAARQSQENRLVLSVRDDQIDSLIRVLAQCRIKSLSEEKHTLEEYFMKYYGGSKDD